MVEVHLNRDSIVNEQTGEVSAPSEYVENLRAVEGNIQRHDDEIAALRGDLKRVKDRREQLVTQLRAAVREGRCLPLLELDDDDPDGLDDVDQTVK
jgi:septal ring factor EnvC (AmiA/AmiB activator)